jgi:hypothetical protein
MNSKGRDFNRFADAFSQVGAVAALTAELHHWDVVARQPLSGQTQHSIRDRQRALRARKFDLKC